MEDSRDKTDFNYAISYLNRINALFIQADESSMTLDMYNWFHSLLAIFREISTEMKGTEIDKYNERIETINSALADVMANSGGEIPNTLYMKLHKLELDLRKVFKDTGMQMKYKDDASHALKG